MADDTNIAPPATQDNTNVPAATEPAVEAPTTPGLTGDEKAPKTEGLMGETPEGDPKGDTEGDPAEGKAEGDEADKETDGAPESYKEFNVSEGYEMSPEQHEAFSAEVKDLNLTQDQAQKLVDFDIKRQAEWAEKAQADQEATLKEWQSEVKKEFGDKYREEIAVAGKAYTAFASPELQAFFTETGLNSHPEVVKMFNAMGKAISEDSFVKGGNANNAEQSEFSSYSELLPQNKSLK